MSTLTYQVESLPKNLHAGTGVLSPGQQLRGHVLWLDALQVQSLKGRRWVGGGLGRGWWERVQRSMCDK